MCEGNGTDNKTIPTVPIDDIKGTIKSDGGSTADSPSKKTEKLQVEAKKVATSVPGEIDGDVRQNAIESDREYRKITGDIIRITQNQLEEHTEDKKPLRRDLLDFIKGLLAAQFGALVVILLMNNAMQMNISDGVIQAYIVSVFVETLAGLIIMIRYAFDSTQEVKLIEILNEIISHFKKYDEK